MDREFFGIKVKIWAMLVGAAIVVGLYLRHRAAAADSSGTTPVGGQVPARARPRGGGGSGRGYRTVRTTVTKPGRVVVVNRYRCPPGTHKVGKKCVPNNHGHGPARKHHCPQGQRWSAKRGRCVPTGIV